MTKLRKLMVAGALCLLMPAHAQLSKEDAKLAAQEIQKEWMAETKAKYEQVYKYKVIYQGDRKMDLFWTVYGNKPADGRSLYISLHGGGGVPYEDNMFQWRNQWNLYTPKEGVYVAPHCPVSAWNMWCQTDADAYYADIIKMAVTWLDVNPDKVYLLGYSAGGDGVWRMAPRMADAWAAASMMAGHPGDVRLENLRNLPFMIWCGANDSAYNRNRLCAERIAQMDSLQQQDGGGYRHEGHIMAGKGHWMDRADTAAIGWMAQFRRTAWPHRVVWHQAAEARPYFYWLGAPRQELARDKEVRAEIKGQTVEIERCDYSRLCIYLNDEMLDLDKPVTVRYRGRQLFKGRLYRTATLLRETLRRRGDLRYSFPAVAEVTIPVSGAEK